jgi:hypothetical protein
MAQIKLQASPPRGSPLSSIVAASWTGPRAISLSTCGTTHPSGGGRDDHHHYRQEDLQEPCVGGAEGRLKD